MHQSLNPGTIKKNSHQGFSPLFWSLEMGQINMAGNHCKQSAIIESGWKFGIFHNYLENFKWKILGKLVGTSGASSGENCLYYSN